MTKHAHNRKSRSIRMGEAPTSQRRKQQGGFIREVVEWDGSRSVIGRYRARWTCPLDAYRDYGFITGQEHQAGVLFNRAYFVAVSSRGAARERYNYRPDTTRLTVSERIVRDAYHVLTPFTKKAVVNICGHEQPAQDKLILGDLKDGLNVLSKLWNVSAAEVTGHRQKTRLDAKGRLLPLP